MYLFIYLPYWQVAKWDDHASADSRQVHVTLPCEFNTNKNFSSHSKQDMRRKQHTASFTASFGDGRSLGEEHPWSTSGEPERRSGLGGGCGGGMLDRTRSPFSSRQTLPVSEISAEMLVKKKRQRSSHRRCVSVVQRRALRDQPLQKEEEGKKWRERKKTKTPCWLQEAESSNTNTLCKEERGDKLKPSERGANDKQLQLFLTASGSCCTFVAVDEAIPPQRALR